MITRDRGLPIDAGLINSCIAQFNLDSARRKKLFDYYSGKHAITLRIKTKGLPNNKLVHPFPQYIATMTSGYLIGDPVQYMDSKQEKPLEVVLDAYSIADIQSIDSEIALNQSIYGRGVELVYANSKAMPRTSAISPADSFVVYDDTVEMQPFFGVYRLSGLNERGQPEIKRTMVYTDREIIEYKPADGMSNTEVGKEISKKLHRFGYVPMVEYWNNSIQTGDFESVLSLIDAYDTLESDRINDKEQFADALLVLYGIAGFDNPSNPDDERTPGQRLREERTITLPDVTARAEYLTKALNEADTDVLRAALKADIHKFSMVPDLTDENFAGNSSGVAMKYKLLGLEQLTKIKERWFREGLRWRLRLFASFLALKGAAALDPDQVNMTFKRSLPVNDVEIASMVQTLQGLVPDSILLAQVPFVEDVNSALEELKQQKKDSVVAQAAAFGVIPGADPKEDEEEVPKEFD